MDLKTFKSTYPKVYEVFYEQYRMSDKEIFKDFVPISMKLFWIFFSKEDKESIIETYREDKFLDFGFSEPLFCICNKLLSKPERFVLSENDISLTDIDTKEKIYLTNNYKGIECFSSNENFFLSIVARKNC